MTAVDRPDNGQDEGRRGFFSLLVSVDGAAVVCASCGALVLDNLNAMSTHRNSHPAARPGAGEQQREAVARYLADGIAQYVGSFMSCVDSLPELRAVDFQFMAEDFIESCDVIPELLALLANTDEETADVAASRACWCATCEAVVLANDHPTDPIARMAGRRFVVCRDCGDKRCPRASHHVYDCVNTRHTDEETR